jgi:SAM-dependent methyltransferase
MSTPQRAQPQERAGFDVRTPNIARVYDFWLGGKDNFAADRAEAERMTGIYPQLLRLARENRAFLARAVTWMAAQGIRQFLDIGSGLPTACNTHQAAQAVDPSCRVIYADNDPVVVTHATALLSGDGVATIQADLADPAGLTTHPAVADLIKPDQPVALILALVLHFFDATAAEKIMADLTGWLAPGSYVVISVGSGDERIGGTLAREYKAGPLHNHPPGQIAAFLDGLDILPPGLVDARFWQPGAPAREPRKHQGGRILAGIGRKPHPAADQDRWRM